MDYIIKYNLSLNNQIKISYCDDIEKAKQSENILYIKRLKHLDYIELTNNSKTQLAIGDVIKTSDGDKDLANNKGIFYLITLFDQNRILRFTPDEHGLLPIYYFEQGDYVYISSSFMALVPHLTKKSVNPDYYIELAILYTQISGSTYFKEIKRLSYGECIELNNGYSIITTNRFWNFFTEKPESFNSSLFKTADKFIELSKFYVQEPCAISLTGGFDGRTITGCAHYHKSDFINFSYGRRGNGDVDNPLFLSKELGLRYSLIELEQGYLDTEYTECVDSYLKYSGGLNGFQYPQSIYYAKLISGEKSIIVTGYLGSEILANSKGVDDELNSQCVIHYLKTGSISTESIKSQIENLTRLGIIQNSNSVIATIENMSTYFNSLPKHLTTNQKLAVFSFENTHRNTFGPWIYNAMHYAKVRVPFMDKEFLTHISKTRVSQFYRDFLENSPLKRIYGQVLYPTILEKVWPEINKLNSSKGYPPKGILTTKGQLKIALNRLVKTNAFPERHGLDKMSTISGAISFIKSHDFRDSSITVEKEKIIEMMNESTITRSFCFLALSKFEFNRILNS